MPDFFFIEPKEWLAKHKIHTPSLARALANKKEEERFKQGANTTASTMIVAPLTVAMAKHIVDTELLDEHPHDVVKEFASMTSKWTDKPLIKKYMAIILAMVTASRDADNSMPAANFAVPTTDQQVQDPTSFYAWGKHT